MLLLSEGQAVEALELSMKAMIFGKISFMLKSVSIANASLFL
jgi:hypothetical protein